MRQLQRYPPLVSTDALFLSAWPLTWAAMMQDPHMSPGDLRRARVRARFERQFLAIEQQLPWLRRPLTVIRARGWWVIRLPIALLFIAGGILSILPFLGLWMLPVGLLLLAVDLPLLRAPLSAGIIRSRRRYMVWRHKRGRKTPRK